MKIKYTKLRPEAKTPLYASADAAGADLCACIESPEVFAPGVTKLIPTGIAVEIPSGYVGLIYARSGLSTKRGLAPANKVGVIDADYRGEIFVPLHNHSAVDASIAPGERIAQLVIAPVLHGEFEEVDTLTNTDRGTGGFGSTGK